MRVAFLFGSLNRGGTETLMLDVFNYVHNDQIELLAIYRKEGVLRKRFEETKKPIIHLSLGKNPFNYLLKLRNLLKRNEVQIVHAVQSLDAFFAVIATIGIHIKVCQTIHGFDAKSSWFDKLITSFSLRFSGINLFVSNYQQAYYKRAYNLNNPVNTRVIYNGINFEKLKPGYGCSLNVKFLRTRSTTQIITVGNFNAVRDQLSLCKYALKLKMLGFDFCWKFAGKRIENEPWRFDQCVEFCKANNLEDNVLFLGSRDDVPQLLSQADLFVYASEHDTFGIAVIEAIAAGVPVMVNDWPVMNEITLKGELATIYKTKSEKSFFACFSDFMVNRDRYSGNAKIAAEKVRELYSIDNHINQLIDKVYKPLLSNS